MLADLFKEAQKVPRRNISLEELNAASEYLQATEETSDELEASLEELEQIEETLEQVREDGKVNETDLFMTNARLKHLGDLVGYDTSTISLESHGDDPEMFYQVSMEAVTGIWNRIKQVIVADFQMQWDAYIRFFSTAEGWAQSQKRRHHKLRQEWKDKKPTLNEQKHLASLAGSYLPTIFRVDGRFSKDPLADLAEDSKYATYINMQYPKDLAVYLEKVRSILNSAKTETDEQFEKTVLEKLSKLEHPFTVYKGPGVGKGNVLLTNKGLEVWKGRAVKPVHGDKLYQDLADLCVKTHVREYVMTWSNMNSGILEDFYFTTSDVDKMLDFADKYCDFLISAKTGFVPLQRAFKNLASTVDKVNDIGSLSPVNRKAFKQTLKFVRGLKRYAKTPYFHEQLRVKNLIPGIRILASRTIATAK